MFEMRADGVSLGAISDWLYQQGIPFPRGKEYWSRVTVKKLLQNEKYIGSVILQKTYIYAIINRDPEEADVPGEKEEGNQ